MATNVMLHLSARRAAKKTIDAATRRAIEWENVQLKKIAEAQHVLVSLMRRSREADEDGTVGSDHTRLTYTREGPLQRSDNVISGLPTNREATTSPTAMNPPKELVCPITLELMKDPVCLLYTSPSPRDQRGSRMPSSA